MRRRGWLAVVLGLGLACGAKRPADATATPADATEMSATEPADTTTIRGRVLGVDGRPPAMAHVRVLHPGDGDPEVAEVDVDGEFELKTTWRGLAMLELTGVDHAQSQLPIIVGEEPIEVQATLGTYPREDELADLQIVFWTGDPSRTRPTQSKLSRRDDGTWTISLTLEAPEVHYQLSGFTSDGRIVNGPVAERYEYDGGGDYRSIVTTQGRPVEITIDPAALLPAGREPKIEFPGSAELQSIADFAAQQREAVRGFQTALAARFAEDPEHAQELFASYDWSASRRAARATIAEQTDPGVRRVMAASYFETGNFDPPQASDEERALAAELLGDMNPEDPVWSLWPDALATAVDVSGDPRLVTRFESMLAEELPAAQAASFIFERLVATTMAGDTDRTRRYFELLTSGRFKDTQMAQLAQQFDPDRAIQAGRPLPGFEFGALPDEKGRVSRKYTAEDLRGKVYLVDFWATWCGPCVADMPSLHAAYDKYGVEGKQGRKRKGRKFDILSVSVDSTPDVVHRFRDRKFAMPWQHAHVDTRVAADIFGFRGIPFAVLIDEKGRILASTPQLNGRTLDGLLAEILDDPKPAG